MNNVYTLWAVVLSVLLELGIIYLSYFDYIGRATTLSAGFAVAAVMVAAIMLSDAAVDHSVRKADADEERPGDKRDIPY